MNFGPKNFKIFNYWMENDSFSEVDENSWKCGDYICLVDFVLKNKIKKLKLDIKHCGTLNVLKMDVRKRKFYQGLRIGIQKQNLVLWIRLTI